jgi:hypothetical protein
MINNIDILVIILNENQFLNQLLRYMPGGEEFLMLQEEFES